MKSWLIQAHESSGYFALFYLSAFLLSFVVLILEGRKRTLPTLPWLITIGFGFVFFVFGCHFAPLSAEDWKAVLNNQQPQHATGLSMVGGLLLCVPAIFLCKWLFRLHESVLDAYAFVLPLGVCVQRIGCFLTGCCYGNPTKTWGVQYEHGSFAFNDHQVEGLIPGNALSSVPIHPVQLYEALGCLITIALLYAIQKRQWSAERLFYLSGLLYYVVRFITEFFRDTDANALHVSYWLGLNSIQWLMIGLISSSVAILYFKRPAISLQSRKNREFAFRHVCYFFLLCFIFLFCSRWLSLIEILAINLVLFTTLGYLVVSLFQSLTVPRLRIASLSLMLLSLILMSQTYPEPARGDSARVTYNTISIGVLGGNQYLTKGTVTATGCNGPMQVPEKQTNNTYQVGALGFSRTIQKPNGNSFSFGLNAFTGKHEEVRAYDASTSRIYGLSPYIQNDTRIVGLGVGAHLGDFTTVGSMSEKSALSEHHFYPQLYLRVGELKKLFIEFSFARNFPTPFPSPYFQANLGFGLNKGSRFNGQLRIGTSTATGFFVSTVLPIKKILIVEPSLGFGGSFITKSMVGDYDEATGVLAGVNLHYKFNRKSEQK